MVSSLLIGLQKGPLSLIYLWWVGKIHTIQRVNIMGGGGGGGGGGGVGRFINI